MEHLGNLLKRAPHGLEFGWLYLPQNGPWQPEASAVIIDVDHLDSHDVDQDDEPIFAKQQGLAATLESRTVEDIVASATALESPASVDLLVEAFNYYFEFDSFLPERGHIPLSRDEWRHKVNRDFYDALGPESLNKKCHIESCERGKITGSLRCKVHHYGMVRNKPCPFTD
ncbi:DUF7716 domain-containing protein [Kistimonas asteriae]|uniref:DUF7716 domain-containing protein n=1 Tax=Kistimonas asteriae TaxID=517724 RepID=UPI001BAB205F|nr:hypothetical protein [Kistimonas asteriae]